MTWYYMEGGTAVGPISESTLDLLVRLGTVNDATLVWREGMDEWQPYRVAGPGGPKPPPVAEPPPAASGPASPAPRGGGAPGESASAAGPDAAPRSLRFAFKGSGREYFGIWSVNILLMIVTLGVYTAWAKVRRKRYFYGNTVVDDAPFEYLAGPIPILKGWLLAAGLVLGYSFGSRIHPAVGPALLVLFGAVAPWLIVRSRIFNARNSAFRNIRFGFRPNYREAYLVFLGLTLLVPLTLGIVYPYADYRRRKFIVENSSWGTTPFTFEGRVRDFYVVYLKALFLAAGAAVAVSVIAAALVGGIAAGGGIPDPLRFTALGMAVYLLAAAAFYVVGVYVRTSVANLTFNGARLGDVRFRSTLEPGAMIRIQLSNAAAAILTLGLFVPWARVRVARYRCDRLAVEAPTGLEGFRAAELPEVGAAGEEISSLLDIDIAI